jgi:hypothetical protein
MAFDPKRATINDPALGSAGVGSHQRRDAGGSWRGSQSSMPQKDVPSGSWPQSLWTSNVVCETDIPHVFD